MNGLQTAKLKISDYLNTKGIPCLPDYPNKSLIEKISLLLEMKIPNLNADQLRMSVIGLSLCLDDLGSICKIDVLSCCYTKPKVKRKKKAKNKKAVSFTNKDRRWRELRYKALKLGSGSCCLCGATAKDGIKLHVDHIKPKSLYPYLEYDLDNLQVLCEDCNIGKSNKDDTDWR